MQRSIFQPLLLRQSPPRHCKQVATGSLPTQRLDTNQTSRKVSSNMHDTPLLTSGYCRTLLVDLTFRLA